MVEAWKTHSFWKTLCVAALALTFAHTGCAFFVDEEEIRKEILEADPSFGGVLERRDTYAGQMETAQRELALKRATVQRAIEKLREDLAKSQRKVQGRKERYSALMEPENRKLEFAVSMAKEELRGKRIQRSSIGRSMTRLKKSLEESDATWSPQEREHQQVKLEEMLRDAGRLDQEMGTLNEHVRLLKLKLRLLKI